MNYFLPMIQRYRALKLNRLIHLALLTAMMFSVSPDCFAQKADKYALLVGVNQYEHSRMNDIELKYPENDATAVAEVLEKSGYSVKVLLGEDATQSAVREELAKVEEQGAEGGAVLVGLFGHGVQYDEAAYYCPYNTGVRIAKDSNGNTIRDENGRPRLEPKPETMVSMRAILDALTVCGASNRILMADCCRNKPRQSQGQTFGSTLTNRDLPEGTVALFACSANEQSFEHDDWQHGAFAYSFLQMINDATGKVTSGLLSDRMYELVGESVKNISNGASTQTVYCLSSGRVDLLLKANTETVARSSPAIAKVLTKKVSNSIGMEFTVIPKGSFLMGSPANETSRHVSEFQHPVTLTNDFAIGTYEVSQAQWKRVMETEPWEGKSNTSEDGRSAASWTSWYDANLFCMKLSLIEGIKYRLPTEAEWEYACRGRQDTAYSFGDDTRGIWDFSWSLVNNTETPQPCGELKPNPYGLYDIHGNVWEWCSDWYDAEYYRSSPELDPTGPETGLKGIMRGGCFL